MGIQHVLNMPIQMRCGELTVLLDRANLLELHNVFPILINHIFGPQGTVCWPLRTVIDESGEDYKQMYHFFSPSGPMFRLIYNLLKDPNVKYEYPLEYLPEQIRQFLVNSSGHPFYGELCHINSQTKRFSSLLLNPFDYYFFQFAYHLINPWQQRSTFQGPAWNTLYFSLCLEYIKYFLPIDPESRILPEIYYNGKNPHNKHSSPPSSLHTSPSFGLLNSPQFNKSREDYNSKNLTSFHPRNDIWRSESVLIIFSDMWFCNNSLSKAVATNDLNFSFNNSPKRVTFNDLPSAEYIRIARALIKQLHSFSDSAKCDDSHLCELKKICIPMIQGKFYVFLRNLIHRWPLDGSFRLVLELWLTYIQPWRYPATNLIKLRKTLDYNPDAEDTAFGAEKYLPTKSHMQFIAENLLCYVVILEQLLPRFSRVDLTSPKMSLMLYRIAKVYGQQNLVPFLKEIEQSVESRPSIHRQSVDWNHELPSSIWSSNIMSPISNHNKSRKNVSFLHSTVVPDKKWYSITRQKIYELEGSHFCYKKLFSEPPAQEVYDLLCQIKKYTKDAQVIVAKREQEESELYGGFIGTIRYFFQSSDTCDEFSLDERRKVPLYLEVTYNNFKNMFDVSDEDFLDEPEITTSPSTGPDLSSDLRFLTPQKVKSRLKMIKYEGDPDLEPIRSDECTFLVRALYQLACKVNENFGSHFYRLYHSATFWGRLSRQILLPPTTIYKYDKTILGSPRVSSHLPPRISFRQFGSFKLLTYFVLGAILSMMMGYRVETYVLLLGFGFLLYKMVKAVASDGEVIRHSYPTQGFGNISFNDSF